MSETIHQHFLSVAEDLSAELVAALKTVGPIHMQPDQSTPFAERLCRAIAGQQLSVKAASTIWGRVKDVIGEAPIHEQLGQIESEELRACGLSAAKTKSMQSIAAAAKDGMLDPAELATMQASQRAERMTGIWGVGQWTADMLNIFYFGEPDIWPDGDVTARKTLTRLTSPRRKTTRTAQRFAPNRSYLAMYMWRYVDARPE